MAADPNVIREYFRRYIGREPTPAELQQQIQESANRNENNDSFAARVINHFKNVGPSGGGGGGEEGGAPELDLSFLQNLEGASDFEKQYFEFLRRQIEGSFAIQDEENARVQARRSRLDALIREKYGISLEEFEGQEAFRAAKISRMQSERLSKALKGELPVDPALERQIDEDEKSVRAKLLAQVGPGFEQSSPGIESLADFRQRAEELRSAARHDEIDRGISPAMASAQYGLSLVGDEGSIDPSAILGGLQGSVQSRGVSVQAASARANALAAMQEMAMRERLGMLDFEINRQRNAILASQGGEQDQTRLSGSGSGRLAGAAAGAAATAFLPQRRRTGGDPFYT